MKILKLPVETKIACGCGCVFEFDMDDVEQIGCYTYADVVNKVHSKLAVDCPFCKHRHIIQDIIIAI